jgi:ribosomal protein S15
VNLSSGHRGEISINTNMPPRILISPRLCVTRCKCTLLYARGICKLNQILVCLRPSPAAPNGSLPVTSKASVATSAQRKRYKDPYALAQSKQRKAANAARQKVLQQERKVAFGDPVRGIETPFLRSFDDVGGSDVILNVTSTPSPEEGVQIKSTDNVLLNHFLTPSELRDSIERSYNLTKPVPAKVRDLQDPLTEAEDKAKHEEGHARATTAIARIVSLANSSSKDKTRANTQRCIETFGRHNTDLTLRPRPPTNPAIQEGKPPLPEKTSRAGPDTGSSEVQIAILTAKIRVLADALEKKRGPRDKMNKRNLRVLVHRRQKLLSYLRRKERGGDRWQHLIEKLGLSEATWKGEISL